MLDIRWHGRAGQGAKTTSHILALALVEAGQWVQAFPEYGPERSGSPMRVYNRSGDRPIRRRDAVTSPGAVVVLDPSLLAEVDVVEGLGADGLLVLNTEEPESVVRQRLRFGGRLVCVAGDAVAAAAGTRHPNVVLLGALAGALGQPPLDGLHAATESTLGGKLAPAALRGTAAALDAGFAVGARAASTPPIGGGATSVRVAAAPPPRYDELPRGAVVLAGAERLRTAGWRGGAKPRVDLSRCVNCLLCWVYCPDAAVMTERDRLLGFDFALCKGCELCVEVCPEGAITMVDEAEALPPYGAVGAEP